jgi:hypothetical protein
MCPAANCKAPWDLQAAGPSNRPAAILIGLDERRENVQPVALRRTVLGAPELLDLAQRRGVIFIVANGANIHVGIDRVITPWARRRRVNYKSRGGMRLLSGLDGIQAARRPLSKGSGGCSCEACMRASRAALIRHAENHVKASATTPTRVGAYNPRLLIIPPPTPTTSKLPIRSI